MPILDRFRKKLASDPIASDKKPVPKKAPAKNKADGIEPKAAVAKSGNELSFRLLRTPHVSEKAARLADRGTYVFDVAIEAEKVSIKKAVEALYKVHVVAVRTIRGKGKHVYRGAGGQRNRWKKALVTVKPGERIDLYEGV